MFERKQVSTAWMASLTALLLVLAPARADHSAGSADPREESLLPVVPAIGRTIAPLGAFAPDSTQDGATIYLNETGPFGASPPASSDPRLIGEQITLTPNPPAPLGVESVEFGLAVQTTTPLLVRILIWDSYDAFASPVNSGLLYSEDFQFASVTANQPGQFYPGVKVFLSSPLSLTDPDIFIGFQFLTGAGGVNAPVQMVFALAPGGPQVGSSSNDFFRDLAPGDGVFTPAERRQFGATSCSPNPPGCQSNMLLHVRGAPNPNVLDPGIDLWQTPGGGATREEFPPSNPLPGGLFDACATQGRTSDPLATIIIFKGSPLKTSPEGILGPTDTIVKRTGAANIPAPGSAATVPIEIVGLSLVSTNPLTVSWNGGGHAELWDVKAALSDHPQQAGAMTVTRSLCAGEGGTYTSSLPVLPKLIFTRRSDACTVVYDTGALGQAPVQLVTTAGHWYPTAPASMLLIEEPRGSAGVDGNGDGTIDATLLTYTTNFHPGIRIPRCGCCQSVPAGCSSFLGPSQCLAAGGSVIPGAACGGAGACEASCSPAGPPEMRMTVQSAPTAALALLPANTSFADLDGDLIPDIGDNCAPPVEPGAFNPLQDDSDDDGVGDSCDNCRTLCNIAQVDVDLDGAGDLCDCAPVDPSLKSIPASMGGVSITRDTLPGDISIAWSSLTPSAGIATTYDSARGTLAALHGAGYAGATCEFNGWSGTVFTEAAAGCSYGAGNGCWYIVRGSNACGTGTYADSGQTPPHPLDGGAGPCP